MKFTLYDPLQEVPERLVETYNKWADCINMFLAEMEKNEEQEDGAKYEKHWEMKAIDSCGQFEVLGKDKLNLKIHQFGGVNQWKRFAILPRETKKSRLFHVSVGIENDSSAESQLALKVSHRSVFIGSIGNSAHHQHTNETHGVFQKFDDSLMKSDDQLMEFLTKFTAMDNVDSMWLDIPGLSLLHLYYKDSVIDQNHLAFCQVNLKIHESKTNPISFKNILRKIIEDQKYIILKIDFNRENNQHFLYFVNFSNRYCAEKFLIG